MAHKKPCAKYQYVITPAGPKILPVDEPSVKDEESPADYNAGGYLPIKLNDTFKNDRYRVVRKLGWGHFSTVWLVKDAQTERHSALKVVKSAGRYAETARDEIKLLSCVQSFSPNHPGRSHIVSFLDSFTHQGPESSHICIVFEPLGENLLALIERHKKKGVPRAVVRIIAKQILLGLEYLHDECDLVHTDIKPENILISIPDIENHIQDELFRSPSPTSRRVGVPLPTKTRSGMTIPHLQQRARRQVQIFDSQPLPSPTRSLGRSSHSNLSLHAFTSGLTSSAGNSLTNTASHIPRVPSSQSTSVPVRSLMSIRDAEAEAKRKMAPMALHPPQFKVQTESSPSTSSSSSSIVSIAISTNAGSNISTPPTSLSQSLALSGLSITRTCVNLQPSPHTHRGRPGTRALAVAFWYINIRSDRESNLPNFTANHLPAISIKLADLGNATPSTKHYTEDIQTRQYRAPEAILGRSDWDARADIWSVGCLVFELLTAEYLFDPQGQGELFTKDDDHMAQILELMGDVPMEVKMGGKYSRELFDHIGALRYIRTLKFWPLKRVMIEKYLYTETESIALCGFLEPMLAVDMRERAYARDMKNHKWLQLRETDGSVIDW
ncbi:kinase-like domain-containing protein [Amanita rubescens]|nr:kinase-like domain-containing protein [Amanita rubescens]